MVLGKRFLPVRLGECTPCKSVSSASHRRQIRVVESRIRIASGHATQPSRTTPEAGKSWAAAGSASEAVGGERSSLRDAPLPGVRDLASRDESNVPDPAVDTEIAP
jgi:hypothetical protein